MSAEGQKYRETISINSGLNFIHIMDSVEVYARQWEKREQEDMDTLSKWVRSLTPIRIKQP